MDFHTELVFVPGKPFKPSLMFAGKARAYPSEAPFRDSRLRVVYHAYPQALDLAGKF